MPKFYITTSIPYVNGPPHIGHALEFVQADAIARYRRARGDDVFFLTGTDEHGAKISRAAAEAGESPKEFTDKQARLFRNLTQQLAVVPDDAIRTSDKKRHWPGAEELWLRIAAHEDLYKGVYKGMYCVGHEAFVTEKDLKNGICEDHGTEPEVVEEENYFFRLSEYGDEIRRHIETGGLEIFPEIRRNEALSFLAEGVQDISFSRPAKDIPWGIPVPGDKKHTMYVWCDALSNYISALGFGSDSHEKVQNYWPADMHVIGKDILRFHAIIWPAMLLSAGLPLPKRLFVHGHIHAGGKKMSKSLGNSIDPVRLIETYGTDAVRYILLGAVPTLEDSDLTLERIHDVYTAHLANGIGNLVQRTVAMAEKYFGGTIAYPAQSAGAAVPLKTTIDVLDVSDRDLEIAGAGVAWFVQNKTIPAYTAAMEAFMLDKALEELMRLVRMLDGYIQDYEPYKLVEQNKEYTEAVLWNILFSLHALSQCLLPFLPETARHIADMIGASEHGANGTMAFTAVKKTPLFPRIDI